MSPTSQPGGLAPAPHPGLPAPSSGAKVTAQEDVRPMNGKQQRLLAALRELAAQPCVLGATLVSRDGIRVMDAWTREIWNKETFSAMSATLMGAAEIALSELGGVRTRRVVAETNKTKLIVVGCTDELVLVALADEGLPLERMLPLVEAAAERVTKIVAGE
jgi:predicted regulator of Ras-like GTPase activity (Roadblock/LC7/MglB family)